MDTRGFAATVAKANLTPFKFSRRELRPHDVAFDVAFSGICHSDIHQVNEDWGPSIFPMVPGSRDRRSRHSDWARRRPNSRSVSGSVSVRSSIRVVRANTASRATSNIARNGQTGTYNDYERDGTTPTYGGYCDNFVVDENYAVHVSETLNFEGTAPLLCAGITLYSPLRHWGATDGKTSGDYWSRRTRAHGREIFTRAGRRDDRVLPFAGKRE